uniref:IlGF domain-containing protein n=1 Tax=Steinernema glaseri TaxID=37863 RepID=A0A1I7YMC3_9BILA
MKPVILLLCLLCLLSAVYTRAMYTMPNEEGINLDKYATKKVCNFPSIRFITQTICDKASERLGKSFRKKTSFSYEFLQFPWSDPVYPVMWACCLRHKCDSVLLQELCCEEDT